MPWFRATLHMIGLAQTAVVATTGALLDSAVASAIIGGAFLLANTALTLYLARRYDREADTPFDKPSRVQQGTDHQDT